MLSMIYYIEPSDEDSSLYIYNAVIATSFEMVFKIFGYDRQHNLMLEVRWQKQGDDVMSKIMTIVDPHVKVDRHCTPQEALDVIDCE